MIKYNCTAFVIKSSKYKENDRMLTLFSKEYGKISVIAKGGLSLKCKYFASLQLFNLSEFELSTTAEGKIPYISNAELLNSYDDFPLELVKYSSACYVAELINSTYEQNVKESVTFHLLKYTLNLFKKNTEEISIVILLCFILKFLGIHGLNPNFKSCTECGSETSNYFFNIDSGGIVCTKCIQFDKQNTITALEAAYLDLLTYAIINEIDFTQTNNALKSKKYLFTLLNSYIEYTLYKRINSYQMLINII